ncbi:MAG: DNA-methyltransferase [Alphaproteobacteria bacterium]|jgi:site-specific DNA-methyltransferase (adenine-specific)
MARPFRLYHGDCLEILESLPPESVDLVFADPPYNLSNDGFTCQGGRMVSVNKGDWDKSKGFNLDVAFHHSWLWACRRVLKPNGALWVSGTYHSIYACGHALQFLGYHILNDICWFKPNASPNLSCRFFTASHETLIWAKKSKKAKHTFNYPAMKDGSFPEDKLKEAGKQMRTAWVIPTTPQSEKVHGKHPTQKPMALLERIILASTNAGDIVLDPFSGSGTTGVAAVKHGRKFVGIEKEKEFVMLSQKRLESAVAKVVVEPKHTRKKAS